MNALKAAILTISDRGARGEREDLSSIQIENILKSQGFEILKKGLVPDERERIKEVLKEWADDLLIPLIITTGGTGLHPSDVTPQATEEVIDYPVPGISEIIRIEGFKKTPYAILSRAIAGVRGSSLIINLPGSPKAVKESLNIIIHALPHAIEKLLGSERECGSP